MLKKISLLLITLITIFLNSMENLQKQYDLHIKPDLLEPTSLLPEIKNIINDYYKEWEIYRTITNIFRAKESLAFTKNNAFLAIIGTSHGNIKILDLEKNKFIKDYNLDLETTSEIHQLFFVDDDLIILLKDNIKILNFITDKFKLCKKEYPFKHIALSSNGKFLAYSSANSKIDIYKTEQSVFVNKISLNFDLGPYYKSICISPSGKLLATGMFFEIKIWETKTNKMLYNFEKFSSILIVQSTEYMFDFSYNDKLFAAINDKDIKICDINTGNIRIIDTSNFKDEDKNFKFLTFSPHEMLLITASYRGTIIFWDPIVGNSIQTIKPDSFVQRLSSLKFSYDGKYLAYTEDNRIIILEQNNL